MGGGVPYPLYWPLSRTGQAVCSGEACKISTSVIGSGLLFKLVIKGMPALLKRLCTPQGQARSFLNKAIISGGRLNKTPMFLILMT